MKTKEIVDLIKAERPALLSKKISEKKATKLIRNAFSQLRSQIESANNGDVVKVRGLGNFRVKQVEREIDGQKTTVKRVTFRAKKPLEKKAEPAN